VTRFLAVLVLAACGSTSSNNPGGDGGMMMSTDPAVQHNLDALNMYRAQNGAGALVLDAQLMQFALDGSQALHDSGIPHQHFMDASASGALWTSGFCRTAGENQAPGWSATNENATIDQILAQMMAEGPAPPGKSNHHDNIIDPQFTRVGIGLLIDAGKLWLTNDFSGACP
jgi:uncharacterized protein YkwD